MSAAVEALAPQASRVVIDMQPGERLRFGGTEIEIAFVGKSGRSARLCIVAPKAVKIDRKTVDPADTSMAG